MKNTGMTAKRARDVLIYHNKWRRGDDDYAETNPVILGLAIDFACNALLGHELCGYGVVSVGSYKLDESGEPSSTIITSNNWPEMIDKAGLRGQWLELVLIPINQLGGDWSLLEATQESLREHTEMASRLLDVLASISSMCVANLSMGVSLDAQHIGQMIYEATGMTEPELAEGKRIREQAND